MKRILFFLSAIILLAACTPKDTDRAALEPYAKEHMENPVIKIRGEAADKTSYDAELEKIDDLLFNLGNEVACYDRTLYFWFRSETGGKFQDFVIGRFSADGRLLEATKDPDSLPTYPALQMLKDQGRL